MRRFRILIAENDVEFAAQLSLTIRSLGYLSKTITSLADQTLAEVTKTNPDLVLINLKLGNNVDAIEIASKLRDILDIPIVFVAEDASDVLMQRAKIFEPNGYVFRPLDTRELGSAIDLALYHHRKETKFRQTDLWLKIIKESIGCGVIISNREGQVQLMNSVAEIITGWQQKQALGKPLNRIFSIVDKTTNNPVEIPAEKVLDEGLSTYQTNHYLITKGREQKNIIDWAVPIVSSRYKINGVITFFEWISSPIEMSELVKSIVQWAIDLLEAKAGEIFLYEKDSDKLKVAIAVGFMQEYTGVTINPGEGMAGRVFQSGEPLIVDDYLLWPGRVKEFETSPSFNTVLHVPLKWREKCIGTLGIDADSRERKFNEEDIRLASLFSNLAAIAIENVRQYAEFQTRMENQKLVLEQQVAQRTTELAHLARQLETSARVSREITSILDISVLLKRLVHLIQESFDYYYVQIFLSDMETGRLIYQVSSGGGRNPSIHSPMSLDVGAGSLNGLAAQTGHVIMVNDTSRESHFFFDELVPDTKSELVIPLRVGSRVLGTLDIQDSHIGSFKEEDKLTFESLGDQVAIAIENARLYERSRDLAILEERNRLARELHDSVTQSLFSLDLHARAVAKYLQLDPQHALIQIDHLRQVTHDTLEEMRSLIFDLRPPSIADIGLVSALRQQIDRLNRSDGVSIKMDVMGERRLSNELEEGLYRIAQESLRNAVKHSGASKISLNLEINPSKVILSISDDGRGFNPSHPADRRAFGLIGMRERAELLGANFQLNTQPGSGTKVIITALIDKRG